MRPAARSMPPEISTMLMPQAMIMRDEFWIRMSLSTRVDMKRGCSMAITTIITNRLIMMTLFIRKFTGTETIRAVRMVREAAFMNP